MTYNFKLIQSENNVSLVTPSTCHIRFSKIDTDSVYTIKDVKALTKRLKQLAKEIRSEYNIKITLSDLDKSVREFENLYKRYTFAINTINNKFVEVLEFVKQFDEVEYSHDIGDKIREYYLDLQRNFDHYRYRNGAISICNEIVNNIKTAIEEFEYIKINDSHEQYTNIKRIFA